MILISALCKYSADLRSKTFSERKKRNNSKQDLGCWIHPEIFCGSLSEPDSWPWPDIASKRCMMTKLIYLKCLYVALLMFLFFLVWMYFFAGCLTKNSWLKLLWDLSKWYLEVSEMDEEMWVNSRHCVLSCLLQKRSDCHPHHACLACFLPFYRQHQPIEHLQYLSQTLSSPASVLLSFGTASCSRHLISIKAIGLNHNLNHVLFKILLSCHLPVRSYQNQGCSQHRLKYVTIGSNRRN